MLCDYVESKVNYSIIESSLRPTACSLTEQVTEQRRITENNKKPSCR